MCIDFFLWIVKVEEGDYEEDFCVVFDLLNKVLLSWSSFDVVYWSILRFCVDVWIVEVMIWWILLKGLVWKFDVGLIFRLILWYMCLVLLSNFGKEME